MCAALVLLNPFAAAGRAARLAQPIREWLAAHAPGVPLVESDSIARSRATLQCLPPFSRVVLVGGDGSLHQMLPVLLTHHHVLGLVPVGGGNDTARAFGVHRMGWSEALALALAGAPSRIDTGELITQRSRVPFLSSLAVGFDAAVAQRAIGAPRWLRGMPRYLWATLAEIAALRRWDLRLTLDGTPRRQGSVLFASVLNTPSYGGGMPAVPHARIGDAKLDLLLAERFGRAGALLMLPRLATGTHLGHARVHTRTFVSLHLHSSSALPLAADGEPLPAACELDLRVRAASLSAVLAPVPPSAAKSRRPK